MDNFFKSSLYVCLLAIAMNFIACQNEEPFVEDIDAERTLTLNSYVVDMMERATSYDGSYDNIVDGASCIAIQFPYLVVVNGSELTIANTEDLEMIEDILDAAESEQHFDAVDEVQRSVVIRYPITATLSDQTEIVIASEAILNELASQCIEGGDDSDVECIDMIYPIHLFTYNKDLQQTGSIVVNHDKELRRFLAGLVDTDLLSIDFPITYQFHDSTQVTVNTNEALAEAMQNAVDSCDEDDDDDYNDNDFTKESLESLLVTCSWAVRRPESISEDSPEQYQEELLFFMEDGILILDVDDAPEEQGNWSVSVSDFKVFITMEFQDTAGFNGSRYTYKIGDGLIKLDDGEVGDLLLEQRCDIDY